MSQRPFRFVHAADFRLEQPPHGIVEVPDHLRDLFLEAPYWAAERVIEIALAEQAEFLVLAGNILHARETGPRGPLFLAEQFGRLQERGIEVYWAGGRVDPPEAWPSSVRLPENVHLFAVGHPQDFTRERDGVPVVRILGESCSRSQGIQPAEFIADPAGLFSIAVTHASATAEMLKPSLIDYWALGGSHTRSTLFSSPRMAHYPGTIQGRRPDHAGPHGCTLVNVDEHRRIRTTFIPCDSLRWQNERIVIEENSTRKELETRLGDRIQALKEANPAVDLLVSWSIVGAGPVMAELRRGRLSIELLEGLRRDHGMTSPAAWSVSLSVEPTASLPPEWYEQDSIRGDYLRLLRQYRADAETPIDLEAFIPEQHRVETLAAAAKIADAAERERVLREAAMLGVDLLSGEDCEP